MKAPGSMKLKIDSWIVRCPLVGCPIHHQPLPFARPALKHSLSAIPGTPPQSTLEVHPNGD